jgi:hypothetical protein
MRFAAAIIKAEEDFFITVTDDGKVAGSKTVEQELSSWELLYEHGHRRGHVGSMSACILQTRLNNKN